MRMATTRKSTFSLLLISIFICISVIEPVLGETNSIADSPPGFVSGDCAEILNLTDDQIATFWDCISSYQNVSEFGSEGYVKFANNKTHLFGLVVCTADSEWVSIEFNADTTGCMQTGHDGWSFYITEDSQSVEAFDVYFMGTRIPDIDSENNLIIESIFSGDLVFIEVVRPFVTNNCGPTGCDITYINASLSNIQFASKDDHYGSHTIFYLLISDQLIGEGVILPPDLPGIINYDEIKFNILSITAMSLFGFLVIHFVRRVVFSPIKHEHRLISSSMVANNEWSAPNFKERFTKTFTRNK